MTIVACDNFKPELNSIFQGSEIGLCYFDSSNCRLKHNKLFDTEKVKPHDSLIFGGYCLGEIANRPEYKEYDFIISENCFYQLLNKPMIEKFQSEGHYLVSKGWLIKWRSNIEQMGFTQNDAKDFWSVFPKSVLFLNTDEDEICKELEEFCHFIDKDYSVVEMGLYNYENTVKKEYIKKYSKIQKEKLAKDIRKTRKEVSDYQLAFEVFHEIINLQTVQEVIEEILRLIQILSGAENVSLIPIESDLIHETMSVNGDYINDENNAEVERFKTSGKTWLFGENKHQLLLKLMFQKLFIGIILIENIKFPEFSDSYKDLLLRLNTLFGILIINRKSFDDIKEKERLLIDKNIQLKKSYKAVSESIKLKEFLIAKTSHEIRNPLSGIIGLSSQIQDEIESQKIKKMSSLIEDAGNRILLVVNDLLNYSKSSNKSMKLSYNFFKIFDFVDSIIQSQISLINKKSIKVRKNVQPERLTCYNDENRIRQIIENLLINALKYSEGSEINILIYEKDELNIIVEDDGNGINSEQAEHIFEPFYRANETEEGSGLGLTIVKEIVDALNGNITLDNRINFGCSFMVSLPFINRGQERE